MRLSQAVALVCATAFVVGCGTGPKSTASVLARQPTDPKAVPTATLPAVLPSPIPAGTVTEGGITGQASTGPGTYTVKPNDTGSKIASTVGAPLSLLQSYNPGVDWSNLKIGQELKVPPPPTSTALSTPGPLRPATSTGQAGAGATRTSTPSSFPTTSSTATSSGGAQTYAVQSGDTACNIATKFNVSLQELAAANATTAATLANLKIGQDLKIPASTGAKPGC